MKIRTRPATKSATEGPILNMVANAIKNKVLKKKYDWKDQNEIFSETDRKGNLKDDKKAAKSSGMKYLLISGKNSDGKEIKDVIEVDGKQSSSDLKSLVEQHAKEKGISDVKHNHTVTDKSVADKWNDHWSKGGRFERDAKHKGQSTQIGKNDYDVNEAKEWNKEYAGMSNRERLTFIQQHFPKSIKSSNAFFQKALLEENNPFTSDIYVFLYKYASTNNKDISDSAAKYMLSNWDVVARAFDKSMKGLDLSKNANQLAAMDYIRKNNLDIPYRNKNTSWLSYNQIKKNIQEHQFTDEEKKSINSSNKKGNTQRQIQISSNKNISIEEKKKLLNKLSGTDMFSGMPDNLIEEAYLQLPEADKQ